MRPPKPGPLLAIRGPGAGVDSPPTNRPLLALIALLCVLPGPGTSGYVWAQQPDGEQVFKQSCASCHNGAADSRAPARDALAARTPQAIIESLMTGAMRPQGSRLSGPERRAVAEFVTGKTLSVDVTGAGQGRCASGSGASGRETGATWAGWSPTNTNTRFQPATMAGLTAADVPRLTLKWSFGLPDASVAWSPPTSADGRLYVGSQNGTVFALDAKTGCIGWTYSAAGGVRTAITIGGEFVYFGDTAANAYALHADTGRVAWTRKVDDHPLARITGSLTLHAGRLYVPVSSYEESQGADPRYECCTFRGSVSALDAATGRVIWKTPLISDPLQRRGTSSAGVPLWGPSGSAVWSPPTIDEGRNAVYVATGNAYSAPAHKTTNAIVALDLGTGAIRWVRQLTPGDVYLSNCRAGNPNCPEVNGPDFDFGSPPVLTRAGGRDMLVIAQKSGMAYALDPARDGEVIWEYRAGQGSVLGGIEWGAAVDDEHAYFAVSDMLQPRPGGVHAVSLSTGQRVWFAAPPAPVCGTGRGCNAAQSAALTAIPGIVFSGSNDGALRAYDTKTGAVVWTFDTNRDFPTINGVPAKGASLSGPGPAVVGGMVYVNSGYGAFGGRPGNVLLAFGLE